MKKVFILLTVVVFIAGFVVADKQKQSKQENQKTFEIPNFAVVFSTESSFAEVKEDLLESIATNGLVISYTSDAKTMLENTAKVAGVTVPVYADAEIVSFCKSDLSHALVNANPHNIVLCPYNIAIYVLYKEPQRVYLSFREVEVSEPTSKPIRELLLSIIEDVL